MKIQLICLLLAMAANVVSSEAAAKSSNYEVVSTEEGLKFVKWSGKRKSLILMPTRLYDRYRLLAEWPLR